MGNLENIDYIEKEQTLSKNTFWFVKIFSTMFGVFTPIVLQIILILAVLMILFFCAVMIKANQEAIETFQQVKLLNLAKII